MAFGSPSGNISCEIDNGAPGLADDASCQTLTPPESATVSPSGSVRTCGLACEGNPEQGIGTLGYGAETSFGSFVCRSQTSGMTCTVSGRGFTISSSGIAPVGRPLVHLAAGSYSGTVASVRTNGSQMTYEIASWSCGAVPAPGEWSIALQGATFVSNSEPSTGQGEAVSETENQWQQTERAQATWSVVVATGRPLEITDGPTC